MGTSPIVSSTDGPRITVAAMVKSPTIIPKRILSSLENQFIADSILRKLPPTQSGAYVYEESTPLFAEGEAPIVAEFGEIPVISGRVGARRVATTVKRALAVQVSETMEKRNDIDGVRTQIQQVKNTFIRTWETAFLTGLLNHPDVHTMPTTAPWDGVGSAIREDLIEATALIEDSSVDDMPEDWFGFSPNTMVIGKNVRDALMLSDDFNKAYVDNIADESILYTGKLPGRFFNVDAFLISREMDRLAPDSAILLERKTVGGIGDERPLRATPLYEDKPRETKRTDVSRQSAIVIDQPKAACVITNVLT